MKRIVSLFAFLLVLLLVHGASASGFSVGLSTWHEKETVGFDQNNDSLFHDVEPAYRPSSGTFQLKLSPLYSDDINKREELKMSFQNHFTTHFGVEYQPDPGYTRKAFFVDINLYDGSGKAFDSTGLSPSSKLSPDFPLSAVMPVGTGFKNLCVFHGTPQNNGWTWSDPEGAIVYLDSTLDVDRSVVYDELAFSKPEFTLQLSVNSFSPFVIVWDELDPAVLSSIESLPDTGDRASLAPWLVLLGASALLLLGKKKTAAST